MNVKLGSRFLSLMLALVMVISMLPVSVFAAETATWTKVDLADITAEDTIMVTMTNPNDVTYALYTVQSGSQGNEAKVVTVADDTITTEGSSDYGWTITPVEGGHTLSVGELYLYTIANNNGVRMGDTQSVWSVSEDGYLSTTDPAGTIRYIGVYDNNGGNYSVVTAPNWRAYKNTTGNTKDQVLGFYKLETTSGGTGETPDPSEPDPSQPVTPPVVEPTIVTIADALTGADDTQFTVKGVVTLVDGQNVYLQDDTDAMGVYMAAAPSDIALGDTIVATGKRSNFKGLEQLSGGTYEKSEGLTLTAKETTIGALTTDDVAHYIKLTGLEITAIDGTKLTLKDEAGFTIATYNSVLGDTTYAVGDKIDFTGALGIYTETLQLRNTLASEIVKISSGETTPPDPTPDPEPTVTYADKLSELPSNGDTIIIYNSGNAMGSAASGKKLSAVEAAVTDGKLPIADTMAQLLVTIEDSSYIFTLDGKYLTSADTGNGLSFADELTDCGKWTMEAATDGAWYIKNVGANYNGNYNQALEYYSGFTTYGIKTTEVYQMQLFLVSKGEGGTETPDKPTVTTSTIAEALAGETGTSFTVKGVVTLVDGFNIYLQDVTGGICVRMSGDTPSDIALGDTIIGTGSKTTYNGLPQLGSGTYEKSEGLTLKAKEVSDRSTLTDADICTYIKLVGMEITEVYDNNGAYSNPNITVKDASGNEIQLYKAVTTKTDGAWDWKVGDKVNITGALSVYNDKLQMRNTLATEIEAYVEPEADTGKVTSAADFTTGTYVMVVGTGYAPGVLDGDWVTAVQPVIEGDKVTDAKGGIWTLTVNGSSVEIIDPNGKAIAPAGGNSNGIKGASYQWAWAFDEATGTFTFSGVGEDTVILASNKGSENKFRAYKAKTATGNPNSYPHAFTLYKVDSNADKPETEAPMDGDQVVIYNNSAKGVLAAEGDNQVITNALATVEDGAAVPANGGVVFTVQQNGSYYRFYNETYGYLCSNGTGNNAFYSLEASEDADWTLTSGKKGGFNLESRTAKFNGKYSQYLEYYADSYKTYSMYNVTDYDIYEFFFYPVAEGTNLTGAIVNIPTVVFPALPEAYLNTEYSFTFEVDAIFGIAGDLTVKAGEEVLTANEDGSYTVPAEKVLGESMIITVSGKDTKGVDITGTATVTVRDEPVILEVSPENGFETGDDKRPVISATVSNVGENATFKMTVSGQEVETAFADNVITYTPASDLSDGRTTATVTVTRADGKSAEKSWTFTVGEAQYNLYFGQLHSHTTYSDGSGTLKSALEYIAGLPESANVDFVAFTDHSNYFDSKNAANPEEALYDTSKATAESIQLWNEYVGAAKSFNAEENGVIAVPGYEMTWSGGPGHMNTFNTPGIVSRNNSTLNNKTSDAGMKAYYALLSQPEGIDTVNQFNHPGSTFGTFSDFAYWDAVIDSRIQLVEVGNGEGQIGAGGYFPSYEYYTMALDKGWHVAPTNNQDNHKGKWGNANDARDVIITDDFSLEGIYEAIRQKRVYATEDKNLEINYTVNGQQLGSSITEVPEKLNLSVRVYDPDTADSISKVEVIVNSGKVAHTWSDPSALAAGDLAVTLDPDYSYYYIRVTQGDGDLAVTAPVWVGESLKLGISSVVCGTSTPVTGEELTLTTTLFNSEETAATIKSITYSVKGGEVIGTDTTGYSVPAESTLKIPYKYTPDKAKVTTITATVVMEQGGQEYTFTMDVELDVQDASNMVFIGIDASHYNEYVAGNYKDSMGNFGALAAEYSVRTVDLKTSEDLIAACSNPKYRALILTAPSRRLAAAQADPRSYSDAEIAAIKSFNENGGMVIMAGWSDNYENYPVIQDNPAILHMAAAQNEVLEGLGSNLRIADDATYDDTYNGGQAYRLYFNTYGDSFLTEGVEVDPEHPHDRLYTEVFSHYGGASVYTADGSLPGSVTPVVFGHSGTYSVDVDKDGLGGNIPKYSYASGDDRLLIMATEQLSGRGLIVVSGAAFMSNFEVQATVEDSGAEKNYSNYKICENLLGFINPVKVSNIADVQAEPEEGVKFTIEGIVTSNASGYDKRTAFFDCIYLQDSTAGINAFPVAGNFKIGDKVRITGTTSSYQGERQIAVTNISLISEKNEVTAKEVTAAQINDRSVLGSLITLKGTVTSFQEENGLVQTIMVKDAAGSEARVFIDGYICTDKDVENLAVGCDITVTGLASYDDTFNAPDGPFARIRIRDREDVVCTAKDPGTDPSEPVFTVSFNANGGTGTMSAATNVSGSYTLPECSFVAPSGKQFKGWATTADGDVITEATINVTADVTLYAIWEAKQTGGEDQDGYEIIDGAEQKVVKGNSAVFTSNAPRTKFEKVMLDDMTLDRNQYTVSGSANTKVTIKGSYLETLPAGEYTITIVSDDGVASTTFTLANRTPATSDKLHQTGQLNWPIYVLSFLGIACIALGVLMMLKKRRGRYAK